MSTADADFKFVGNCSIEIPFKNEDGLLYSNKEFFKLGDYYLSVEIKLTEKKKLLQITFDINNSIFQSFELKFQISERSKIISSKNLEKYAKFSENNKPNSFFLGINPCFFDNFANLSKDKSIISGFDFKIYSNTDLNSLKIPSGVNTANKTKTANKNSKNEITNKTTKTNSKESATKTATTDSKGTVTKATTTSKTALTDKTTKIDSNDTVPKTATTSKTALTDKTTKIDSNDTVPKTATTSKTAVTAITTKIDSKYTVTKTATTNKTAQTDTKSQTSTANKTETTKPTVKKPITKIESRSSPYNGIYNQGATCYINSSIQTLFFIPYFRDVVYHITTSKEGSMVSELQYLFYILERGKNHCSTVKLTKSLKMSSRSVHIQQDIQEFLLSFIEKVQSAAKNDTNLKDKISYIFEGEIAHNIKTVSGAIITSNKETFKQLMVCVSNSIDTSLTRYFLAEKIDDYIVDDKTPQAVTLESKIVKLPRVLQIVIKRYKQGEITNTNVKDDSKVIFKEELDLKPYYESTNRNECTKYKLFSVIVHSGTVSFGHYSVYLKPGMENEWFYFSDTIVRKSTAREAIETNYGGQSYTNSKTSRSSYGKSAYLLFYIRVDSIQEMFIKNVQMPKNLLSFVEKELKKELQAKKSDPSFLINIQVFNELCLIENCKENFVSFNNDDYSLNISVDLRSEVDEIYEMITEITGINSNRLRLWTLLTDNVHIDKIITPMDRIDKFDVQKLFLEIKTENELIECSKSKIFFLFIYSQSISQQLVFLRTLHYAPKPLKYETIIDDGVKLINSLLNLNILNENVTIYVIDPQITKKVSSEICEEINGSIMILRIDENLNSSSIDKIEKSIIVSKKLNQIQKLKNNKYEKLINPETSTAYKYYQLVPNTDPVSIDNFFETRKNMKHVNVYSFENITKMVGDLEVPSTINYMELIKLIQRSIKMESFNAKKDLLLLFSHDKELDAPSLKPIDQFKSPFIGNEKLTDINLYYSIVSQDFALDSTSKTRVVQLSKSGISIERVVCYYWPDSVIHPLSQFSMYNEAFFKDNSKLGNRIFLVDERKNITFIQDDNNYSFDNRVVLRIEKIRPDQISKELVIIQKTRIGKHSKLEKIGIPFLLAYIHNEKVEDFRKRIYSFLGSNIGKFDIHKKSSFADKKLYINDKIHIFSNPKTIYLIFDK